MSPALEKVILENPVESKLLEVARKEGMYTMREDALLKAFAKKVPFSEVNSLGGLSFTAEETEPATVESAPPAAV